MGATGCCTYIWWASRAIEPPTGKDRLVANDNLFGVELESVQGLARVASCAFDVYVK